jgi:hypothetical protein
VTNEPLDRLAADGFVAERMTFYAALYPKLREVARQHGYALALHGSLCKDLDVIAVPWVEDAADEATLVEAVAQTIGGMMVVGGRHAPDGKGFVPAPPRTMKPHGRAAWTIFLGGTGGYIDLSVMPRTGA